ncbi:MAG: hypothetical protein HFJ12_06530 [Bacilli bacterium]|nr:hypothetical protein [Bacilli bacterium]
MAYRLYLNDIKTIQNRDRLASFPKEKRDREKCSYDAATPIKFSLYGKLKDNFKIEEIDSLTCGYKSEKDFILELKKHNISYLSDKEQAYSHLTLAYRQNGKTKECPLIFNDLLLLEQAISLRNQKKIIHNKRKVLTENSARLGTYIQFIKSLAFNKTTRYFILNPKKIGYLNFDEREKLTTDILLDKSNAEEESSSFKYQGLRTLLENYVSMQEMYYDLYYKNLSTLDIERELREINHRIHSFFREDYRNLRKMIEWEGQYRQVLCSCLNKDQLSQKRKSIILLQMKRLDLAKEQRNNKDFYNRDLFGIDEEDEYYSNLSMTSSIISFESERISDLFTDGGVGEVMEQMDLDEILGSSNDAVLLGILPKNHMKRKL